MKAQNKTQLIVAGAGIAGLASALALAGRGHSVTVFEARGGLTDSVEQEGAGIQIGPNGVKCLRALGVADSLAVDVSVPDCIAIMSAVGGQRLATLPLTPFMADRHGAPYWTVRRQALHRVLVDAAQAHPSIRLIDGETVAAPRATAVGIVAMAATDSVDGSALVIADGAGSTLRAALSDRLPSATPLDWSAARAVIPRPATGPMAANTVGLWLGPHCHVVHYPVAAGREVSIVAIARDEALRLGHGQWDTLERGPDLNRRLGRLVPVLGDQLLAVPHWRKWQLFDSRTRLDAPWAKGPMLAIGDAAHPILPYLAQGAVLALEDAVTLGRLFEVGADPCAVFTAFERERRARVERVAATARRNGLIYHQSWTVPRNLVLKALPAPLQLRLFDWLYAFNAAEAR